MPAAFLRSIGTMDWSDVGIFLLCKWNFCADSRAAYCPRFVPLSCSAARSASVMCSAANRINAEAVSESRVVCANRVRIAACL